MYSNYSTEQKIALSLLAYKCLNYYIRENSTEKPERKAEDLRVISAEISTAGFFCNLLAIPYETCFNVRSGNITGLHNLNKFSGVTLFESNYIFNPYN